MRHEFGHVPFERGPGPVDLGRGLGNPRLGEGVLGDLVTRVGGALSGPVPALLRVASLFSGSKDVRRAAAISAIAGSLLTRIAWVYAGHVSARDCKVPLGIG